MSYTPATPGAAAGDGSSSLSGSGGSSGFLTTQIAISPGAPARPAPAAARNDPDFKGVFGPATPPTTKSVSDLIADLYKMSQPELQSLQTRLTQAGYGKLAATGMVDQQTVDAYQALLKDTAAYQAFDNRGLGTAFTPDSFLNQKIATTNAAGGTDPTKTVTLSDPLTARSLVVNSLENHLGRTATPDEIGQFTSALQGYEKTAANPDPSSYADAYATSTQSRANEAGAQNEVGFFNVLSRLIGT